VLGAPGAPDFSLPDPIVSRDDGADPKRLGRLDLSFQRD
jgi:hypothetical protein